MKRFFTVVSAVLLGLFFVSVITATQAVSAHQPPIDRTHRLSLPANAQHTQPITPGAPADIVLLLDRSESQSYDFASLAAPYNTKCSQVYINDMYACVNGGTLSDGTTIAGCNNEPVSDPNFPELTRGICQPFRKSREAAYRFIQQLRPGTDRMALINFAESPAQILALTFDLSRMINGVNSMDVYVPRPDSADGHVPCNASTPLQDLWKCGSSNVGGGLLQAREEFNSARPEAKWAAVVIADGPANRTSYDPRVPWSDSMYGTCPVSEQMTSLKCRDADVNSRHLVTATVDQLYDADDYAREYGDFLGLDPGLYPSLGSAGIRAFTINIGKTGVCLTGTYTPPSNGQPAKCTNSNSAYGDSDAGEQLLRYIADMGDDGNLSTGLCLDTQEPFRDFATRVDPSGRSDDVGLGLDCGNYYFAPDATSLPTITLDIARRILAAEGLLSEFSATPLGGLAPLNVTFDNLSSGSYTSALWTFGDGNTSTALSPTHLYADPGVYTVTLTIASITTTASLTRTNYIDVSAPHWQFYLPIIRELL
jgi:hypothetical protein